MRLSICLVYAKFLPNFEGSYAYRLYAYKKRNVYGKNKDPSKIFSGKKFETSEIHIKYDMSIIWHYKCYKI